MSPAFLLISEIQPSDVDGKPTDACYYTNVKCQASLNAQKWDKINCKSKRIQECCPLACGKY